MANMEDPKPKGTSARSGISKHVSDGKGATATSETSKKRKLTGHGGANTPSSPREALDQLKGPTKGEDVDTDVEVNLETGEGVKKANQSPVSQDIHGHGKKSPSSRDLEKMKVTASKTVKDSSGNESPASSITSMFPTTPSLASFRIPKKAKPTPSPPTETEGLSSDDPTQMDMLSQWYKNQKAKHENPKKFNKQAFDKLKAIKDGVKKCNDLFERGQDAQEALEKLRGYIHAAEFVEDLNPTTLVRSKILEAGGLREIYRETPSKFPWDIVADARNLFGKWNRGQLSTDLMFDIADTHPHGKESGRVYVINTGRLHTSDYEGEANFTNGKWWPLQVCARRDGAHGAIEGGIFGRKGIGAFSVIMSGGSKYEDVDEGTTVKYCGTKAKDGDPPTAATNLLLESYKRQSQIRVLRSSKMKPEKSSYRPVQGIRYDGLYKITSYQLLDPRFQLHRFTMVREPGQDPIRNSGVEQRPTAEELHAFEKLKASYKG